MGPLVVGVGFGAAAFIGFLAMGAPVWLALIMHPVLGCLGALVLAFIAVAQDGNSRSQLSGAAAPLLRASVPSGASRAM